MPPAWKAEAPAKWRKNSDKVTWQVAASEGGGAQARQFIDQKRSVESFQKSDTQRAACFATRHGGYDAAQKLKELAALSDNRES